MAALHVAPGFKIELAADPKLSSYPMMGTFDDRGRLFIAESSGNTLSTQQMRDHPDYRIRLLEDRDGDGVFEHSQVFAESSRSRLAQSGIATRSMWPLLPICCGSKTPTAMASPTSVKSW
jgi:hypothetical protein